MGVGENGLTECNITSSCCFDFSRFGLSCHCPGPSILPALQPAKSVPETSHAFARGVPVGWDIWLTVAVVAAVVAVLAVVVAVVVVMLEYSDKASDS